MDHLANIVEGQIVAVDVERLHFEINVSFEPP
jgi:hypothetical protein